jgi:hypothetical protein
LTNSSNAFVGTGGSGAFLHYVRVAALFQCVLNVGISAECENSAETTRHYTYIWW